MIKTNIELIAMMKKIATEYKTLYVNGCFGAPMNAANKKRYVNNNDYNRQPVRSAMINAASPDTFGFDCVCLLKGVLWGWNGDTSKIYGGAVYTSNNVPDIGENTMITLCDGVSSDFGGIEPGEMVWIPGHMGIYTGEGLVAECTPDWKNGVQITAAENIGTKMGYNARRWEKHGKLPYIEYIRESIENPAPSGAEPDTIYSVVPGDTLSKIASMYDTTYNKLAEYNGISNPNIIIPGQKIRIPGRTSDSAHSDMNSSPGTYKTYIVKPGDSLWSISADVLGRGNRYGEIKSLNNLTGDTIYPGQVLKMPEK